MYGPPIGVMGSSGNEGEDGCARMLGFRQSGLRVRTKKLKGFRV